MAELDAFETERLQIRRFQLEDATDFLPLVSLPDVLRYTGERAISSAAEAREILKERQLRDYELYGYGRMACIEKSSGRLIGFSGLKLLEDLNETDVGYRFVPDMWGKGYATESAVAILNAQVQMFGLKRVIGLVEPHHQGSVRVLHKIGLKYERSIPIARHGKLDLYSVQF